VTYAGEADAPEGYDGDWGTPPELVGPIARALDGFDLDPAGRTPREIEAEGEGAEQFAENVWDVRPGTPDGAAEEWFGDVWLNPPYGRKENPEWAEVFSDQVDCGLPDSVTALVPASTTADWFHDHYLSRADWVAFPDTRLRFVAGGSYAKARFGNALFHWSADTRPRDDDVVRALSGVGAVLEVADR